MVEIQKRIYNFEKIRGVDVTSSPINVASNRASYMVNMINEGGVNKKRHGWEDVILFDCDGELLPVNGAYAYESGYVVHAGTRFFLCDKNFSSKSEITVVDGSYITSQRSKGYLKNGKLWIVGAGDYLVYDGDKIQPVMNSKHAYIPTTTVDIAPESQGGGGRRLNGANLFQKKRKNKLVGAVSKISDAYVLAEYYLDGEIDTKFSVVLTLSSYTEKRTFKFYDDSEGTEKTFEYEGNITVRYEGNFDALGTFNYSFEIEDGDEQLREFLGVRGHSFNCENKNGRGRVLFGSMLSAPPIEEESNITVEFVAKYEQDVFLSCSAEVTADKNTLLAVVNNGKTAYFSDYYQGYGYFPDNDFICVGEESEPITAIASLDRGIGIFKKKVLYQVQVNISADDENFVTKMGFTLLSQRKGRGVANEFSLANVNGEVMAMDEDGVFCVSSTGFARRSSNVDKALRTHQNLRTASGVSYDGRYYLFVGEKAYIADTRFKYYENNRLDSSFEYEWWIWDNCPCRCAFVLQDKLYMGTEDGQIRTFSSTYCDEEHTFVSTETGDMILDDEGEFTFNEALDVRDGDSFCPLSFAMEKLSLEPITITAVGSDLLVCALTEGDYWRVKDMPEDSKIYLFRTPINEAIRCTLLEVKEENKITLKKAVVLEDFSSEKEYILARDTGVYTIVEENGTVTINNELGVQAFLLYGEDLYSEELNAKIIHSTPVECEIRTGAIDLARLHSKSLYKLAFTPSADTEGTVEIGYQTNLSRGNSSRFVGSPLSFEGFDFKNFIFDGGFSKTFVKRVFERNFNYIMFRFASKKGPFGIENAQAVYSINNELRGDL